MRRHLDSGTLITLLITLVLFIVALFAKGLSHDLLLEAGVFLVSVKLVLAAYKSSVANAAILDRLAEMERTLARVEGRLARSGTEPGS
jgi:hypothetical protein